MCESNRLRRMSSLHWSLRTMLALLRPPSIYELGTSAAEINTRWLAQAARLPSSAH